MAAKSFPSDPCAIVASLDAEAIHSRLQDIEREADSLRVLLRAARARRGHQKKNGQRKPAGVTANAR
jgi:hypothetical protein